MADDDRQYVQTLAEVGLAVERATERTPDQTQFHVFRNEELVASFRKLPEAQRLFAKLKDESGWTPAGRQLTAEEKLEHEKAIQDRMAYQEYWSQSHKFRGGGRPRRKQR